MPSATAALLHGLTTTLCQQVCAGVRAAWRAALPGECLICGGQTGCALCSVCETHYWAAERTIPRCWQCGIRLSGGQGSDTLRPRADSYRCGRCLQGRFAFDWTIALADYRPPLDILALTLKFRNRPALARDLGRRLSAHLTLACSGTRTHSQSGAMPLIRRPTLLLPTPLSPRRLGQRGYNQAWELTRWLAAETDIVTDCQLLQRSHSSAQASLSLAARQRNMQRTIRLCPGAAAHIDGQDVGVIDDVMTTGATLDAAARILKAAGARSITNLVLFRTA